MASKAQRSSANLRIVDVSTDQLNPAPYNPRKWSDKQRSDLKQSMKRFGLVDPIIVNKAPKRKNVVIGGHFRLDIAKELGYKTVPVVHLHIPDLKKEKELNLRLNRNQGEWDMELLKSFDMDMLLDVGFDDSDLSDIWDDALATEDDNFDVEKELEKIKKPKTKPGDLYQLGKHRLICGDATDPVVIKKLVGKRSVDMIYSDPPYNINLSYDKGVGNKQSYGGTINDNKTDAEYRSFLKASIENAITVSAPNSHVFYWCDERSIGLLQDLYRECGINPQRVCLWIKNGANVTPQVAFNKAYEPCVYGIRGKPYLAPTAQNFTEILNKEIETGNRCIDDILDLLNIWLVKRLPGNEYEHPTQKPPTLHEKPLRRCTKPNDTVLDPFGGSGSTLIACEQMKRRALVCELEPVFCDLILHRYETLTNQKAKRLR